MKALLGFILFFCATDTFADAVARIIPAFTADCQVHVEGYDKNGGDWKSLDNQTVHVGGGYRTTEFAIGDIVINTMTQVGTSGVIGFPVGESSEFEVCVSANNKESNAVEVYSRCLLNTNKPNAIYSQNSEFIATDGALPKTWLQRLDIPVTGRTKGNYIVILNCEKN